jgi:hypothetical protein
LWEQESEKKERKDSRGPEDSRYLWITFGWKRIVLSSYFSRRVSNDLSRKLVIEYGEWSAFDQQGYFHSGALDEKNELFWVVIFQKSLQWSFEKVGNRVWRWSAFDQQGVFLYLENSGSEWRKMGGSSTFSQDSKLIHNSLWIDGAWCQWVQTFWYHFNSHFSFHPKEHWWQRVGKLKRLFWWVLRSTSENRSFSEQAGALVTERPELRQEHWWQRDLNSHLFHSCEVQRSIWDRTHNTDFWSVWLVKQAHLIAQLRLRRRIDQASPLARSKPESVLVFRKCWLNNLTRTFCHLWHE